MSNNIDFLQDGCLFGLHFMVKGKKICTGMICNTIEMSQHEATRTIMENLRFYGYNVSKVNPAIVQDIVRGIFNSAKNRRSYE